MNTTPRDTPTSEAPLGDLLIINQVVGPLAIDMLEDFARAGVRCTVLTGWVDAPAGREPPGEFLRGPRLVKVPAWRRMWTWGRFTLRALATAIRRRRTPMLLVSNPPWVMLAGPLLKRLFGVRYAVLMYDIYPDVAERLGALKRGGWLARRWRRRSGRAMAAAEGVITLGAYMAETLRAHLPAGAQARIEVIPNWADTEAIRPRPKAGNAFAEQHGLVDKFVVMYSGSFGAVHDVDSMIEAAARLRDLPDVHFMLIGGGTQETAVARMVRERALPNLTLLPLQPREVLPLSLAAADCAIVCLDAGYEGVAVPSKAYSCLAAGSALVAVTQPGTELADLVAEEGCGVVVPPRSPDALEAAIRGLHANRAGLAAARAAARRAAEETYSRGRGTARTLEVLAAWLGGSPKGSAPPASPDDNRAGTA